LILSGNSRVTANAAPFVSVGAVIQLCQPSHAPQCHVSKMQIQCQSARDALAAASVLCDGKFATMQIGGSPGSGRILDVSKIGFIGSSFIRQ
jgi:hypothetical protein